VLISTLSGFAMIFFSFSGLWMYIQMWRNRKNARSSPAGSGSNPQRKKRLVPYDVERGAFRSPGTTSPRRGRGFRTGSRLPDTGFSETFG
jgi:hypothetical protein